MRHAQKLRRKGERTMTHLQRGILTLGIAIAVICPLVALEAQLRQISPPRESLLPGTWEIRSTSDSRFVHLRLNEGRNSTHGFDIALSELQGLSSAAISSGGSVQFNIRRDAGTIVFEGLFRSGVGGGTFNFTPSATFPNELARRGMERASTDDLYVLAKANIGIAYLDELGKQGYAKTGLPDLLRAGNHGVNLDYLRGMSDAGFRLGQLDALVKTRDHGVDPDFVNEMKNFGYTAL